MILCDKILLDIKLLLFEKKIYIYFLFHLHLAILFGISFGFISLIFLQAFFSANAAALASRKSSPRVTNGAVQKAVSLLEIII